MTASFLNFLEAKYSQRSDGKAVLLIYSYQGRRKHYKVGGGAHVLRGTLEGFLQVRFKHVVWG